MLAASAFASGAWAQALPAPELSAKAWLLLDETSGQVIASHAATARIEPASLTKIMTAYIVFGALQDGTLKPEQKVRPRGPGRCRRAARRCSWSPARWSRWTICCAG